MSSPYLCVCGDDHVPCYMRADDNAGEQADTQRRSEDHDGIIYSVLLWFTFCNFYGLIL